VIDVESVPVNVLIPAHNVCVVTMQPYIRLHTPPMEPFQWADNAVDAQMDAVRRTLDVAEHGVNGCPAVFTLFPEYTIPGVAGASVIDERISREAWPSNSIVMAGIDGLDKLQYRQLCDTLEAQVAAADQPDSVPNDKWVNCCVVWAKSQEGGVQSWIQAKIRPAWPEQNVECLDMFAGTGIYVFEAKYTHQEFPCRFAVMNCFDWIASDLGVSVREELLGILNESRTQLALDWMFVIQHNDGINDAAFLTATKEFLIDSTRYPFVQRDRAIVLHVNTAVAPQPTRSGRRGFSACVFSPIAAELLAFDCFRPTVCMQPQRLRGSDILRRCNDVVFREMGECIHAFTVRIPRFATGDSSDKTCPILRACVHATRDTTDPRLCGGPVAASVKWTNDALDRLPRLADTPQFAGSPLKQRGREVGNMVIERLRTSDGQRAIDCADWATCAVSGDVEWRERDRRRHADLWEGPEEIALEHTLHSLTCIGMAYSLDVAGETSHGLIETDAGFVQIIAIRGNTHTDCGRHFRNTVASRQITDPVLVLTRDNDNNEIMKREISTITDPDGDAGIRFLDYRTLAGSCRIAEHEDGLRGALDAFLPEPSRII